MAWKPLPPLLHSEAIESHTADIAGVAVGASEVTNDEFAAFLEEVAALPGRLRAAVALGLFITIWVVITLRPDSRTCRQKSKS